MLFRHTDIKIHNLNIVSTNIRIPYTNREPTEPIYYFISSICSMGIIMLIYDNLNDIFSEQANLNKCNFKSQLVCGTHNFCSKDVKKSKKTICNRESVFVSCIFEREPNWPVLLSLCRVLYYNLYFTGGQCKCSFAGVIGCAILLGFT